jgi:hypothetical protein
MEIVRKRNRGTYVDGRWRLKGVKINGKEVAASIRQLSKIFQVEITNKRDSEKYWNKYLDAIFSQLKEIKRKRSPLQRRLRSIEDIQCEGKGTPELQAEYDYCLSISEGDTDHADIPVIHPDISKQAESLNYDESDEYELKILETLKPKPIERKESLQAEIAHYIDVFKQKKHGEWYQVQQALDIFESIAGNISVKDIDHEHFRQFIDKVRKHPEWSETTKNKIRSYLVRFLKMLSAIHRIHVGYITLPEYRILKGIPKKQQYTFEQLQTALQHATGIARTSLLLALNCGFYNGDIVELKPEHINGNYLKKHRNKNAYKRPLMVGCWYLWSETRKHLQFGITDREITREYTKLRQQYDLPEFKALRKTIIQRLFDTDTLEVARLYRCEPVAGCIGTSYVKSYTPEQVKKLEEGLKRVAEWLGVQA